MDKRRFVTGIVAGMALAVFAGGVEAEAKDKQFHASFVGAFTNKDDLSFTGTQGVNLSLLTGESSLGDITVQLVAENPPPDGTTCTPPGGGSGLVLGFAGEIVVVSFPERGDQLFLRLSPNITSVGCFDLTTSVLTGQTTLDVTGGTGRFAGATGTVIKTYHVTQLGLPPSGKGAIGGFTGAFDGTIKLAK